MAFGPTGQAAAVAARYQRAVTVVESIVQRSFILAGARLLVPVRQRAVTVAAASCSARLSSLLGVVPTVLVYQSLLGSVL